MSFNRISSVERFPAYTVVLIPWILPAVVLGSPEESVQSGLGILWMGLGTSCAWLPYLFRGCARPAAVAAAAAVSGLWFWLLLMEFSAGHRIYYFQAVYQGHGEVLFAAACSAVLLMLGGMLAAAVRPAYLRRSVLSAATGAALHNMAAFALAAAVWRALPFGIFR